MLNLVILHYNEVVEGLIKDESLIYTFFAKESIVYKCDFYRSEWKDFTWDVSKTEAQQFPRT